MKTIFKNINNESNFNLKDYPKYILKLNSEFEKIGVKCVYSKGTRKFKFGTFFKELTVLIRPIVNTGSEYAHSGGILSSKMTDCGFYDTSSDFIAPLFNDLKREKIIPKIKIGEFENETCIGYYLRERNIIILGISILTFNWAEKGVDIPHLIISQICDKLKEMKACTVDTTGLKERLFISKFIQQMKEELNNAESSIQSIKISIDNHSKEIIRETKNLDINYLKANNFKILVEKNEKEIMKQIEEIKKLPFVSSLGMGGNGVEVNIGKISLNVSKKSRVLGTFKICINPSNIRIYNSDPIIKSGSIYDSPHIMNGNPCLGEWVVKTSELIASFDLKNLVLAVKLYLQSYNEKSPYVKLEEWDKLREGQPIKEAKKPRYDRIEQDENDTDEDENDGDDEDDT